MGIDLGDRRIGVAISDPSGVLARPLTVIEARGAEQLGSVVRVISQAASEEEGLAKVVVGLPRRLDGSPDEMTAKVLAFVEKLRRSVGQTIDVQDERLTSIEAESRLALRDSDWRSRKRKLDAAAAAVMLQDYLDSRIDESRVTSDEWRRQS